MAEQLGEAVLTVSADTRQLQAGLDRARQQAVENGEKIKGAFDGVSNTLRNLAAVAGVVGFATLTQQIIETGKESERSKIQLSALAGAYGESAQAAQAASRIQSVLGISALEARQNFSQLYAALRGTGIGVSQLEVLFVGLSKAASLSGASTAEASGALLQLRQGLASGVLQGDELRSVLENLPAFAQAVAKELGVNVGQLRKLGSEGKITSDIVFSAAKNLAGATTPGKTNIEQLGAAFTNLREQIAATIGPSLVGILQKSAAGFAVLAKFIEQNKAPLGAVVQSVLGMTKAILPLVIGIQAVRGAMTAWAIASKGVALAQASVLALSGPAGIAALIAGTGFAIAAAKGLEAALKGISTAGKGATAEAKRAIAEFQAALSGVNLEPKAGGNAPTTATLANERLSVSLSELKLSGLQEQLAVTKNINQQDDVGRVKLQNRLTLNEKIRGVQADQLQLQRELDKPRGTGDGQNGTQNAKTIADLQGKIRAGQVEVATQRIQNQQSEAAALRTQQERIRQQQTEQANAAQKLAITRQQIQLEQQALVTGEEVSRTALLRLQQEQAIATAKRQQQDAAAALTAELSKPKAEQDRVVLDELTNKLRVANADVRQAYADAGLSLVQNARSAADALKSAQQGFNSTARGGFQFLTPGLQQQQLAAARTSIQGAVDRGLIRTGVDISTPDKLFQVASFAESIVPAQKRLEEAIIENTKASQALEKKDWNIYIDSKSRVTQTAQTVVNTPDPLTPQQQRNPYATAYGLWGGY